MTWLDFATIFSFVVLLSLAYKRGVVLEVTDLVCLLVGGVLSFRLFRPIANTMHNSVFSGWSIGALENLCLFTVFIITCLVVFSLGLTLQRKAKEDKLLDQDTDQHLGVAVGLLKATIIIVIGMGMMFYNDLFPPREQVKLKRGPVVSMFLGTAGTLVTPLVYVAAPSDLAKDFMAYGIGSAKKKKKKKEKKKKKGKKKESE